MRLRKNLQEKVNFANWCINNGFTPEQAGELIQRARHANSMAVNYANGTGDERKLERARQQFTEYAENLGLTVDWGGRMWPSIQKVGREVHWPS